MLTNCDIYSNLVTSIVWTLPEREGTTNIRLQENN